MAGAPLEHVVARASGLMLTDRAVDQVLDLLTATLLQAVPAACGAGVTAVDRDRDEGHGGTTTAATGTLVEAADAVQYRLAEGPCLTAWLTRRAVRVDVVATDPRWPRWAQEVAALDVAAVLSAPMVAGDLAVGSLKLYAHEPHAFGARDETTLNLFAAQGALLLASARTFRDAGRLSQDVRTVLARRDALQRAAGLLMGRDGLTERAALAHLAARAEQERTGVHQVATHLLTEHAHRVAGR